MALFSNKKEKDVARRESYQQGLLSATGLEAVEAQKARAQAAEESALNVFGRLGAPGTYDTPTGPSTSMAPDIYDTTGPLTQPSKAAQGLLSKYSRLGKPAGKQDKYGTGASTLFDPRTGILDPNKYGAAVQDTAEFRIQSRQTAEAEQLLQQKGPAWDMLKNSTIGRIYEGAAIQNREALRNIRDNLAKGGTARRGAFAQAQELIQIEKAHQMRTEQTWVANEALHKYIRENADRVQESNIKFLDNLPELRATYAQTMQSLTNLLTGQVVPGASNAIHAASSGLQAVAAKDGQFLEGLIMTGITMVAGAALGGAGSAITTAMSTTLGAVGGSTNNPGPATPIATKTDWKSIGLGALKGAGQTLFGGKE